MRPKACLIKCKLLLKCVMKNIFKMGTRFVRLLIKISRMRILWILLLFLIALLSYTRKCESDQLKNYYVKKHSSNPVIVWWTSNFPGTMEVRYCSSHIKCDIYSNKNASLQYNVSAYLFYGSNIEIEDLPRKHPREIWGLYHEESPRNLEVLMHESMLSLFNFSATFSRYSNVPFPLQYMGSIDDITSTEYFIPTSVKNGLLNRISSIIYLQSDCETSTERDTYVKELMKYIQIDSYGACLNNKKLPKQFSEDYLNNLNEDNFLKFVARYKFVVAIENGVCEDYVTEKFWRAIKVGSVPIYFGSPSIRDWFPNNKSAILLDDFPTPEVMSKHIKKLLNNDNLYDEYLEHKIKKVITNQRLVEEIQARPYQGDGIQSVEKFECFICEKLHNKSGLGINIVDKSHYDCPKPVSALTLSVNPTNPWVYSWKYAKNRAHELYNMLAYG
ncbi:unnamed protein product [Diatraea saccharalis]|uniref:Fucosyltransferase n=1 Tax=Diatraea saccharalis TaxID=40085 RepID=A0A9N9QYS4_9NEOP|nr:unnamed protein product [Diatraea saccharalis]